MTCVLFCFSGPDECTNDEVQLVGGATTDEGSVEVCVSGQWSAICDDLWSKEDAEVVCKQLGHNPIGK